MKNLQLIALVILLPALVMAQNLGMQELNTMIVKPEITKIGIVGKGIGILESDKLNFEIIKVGLIDVKIQFENQTIIRQSGLLWIGQNKYLLKNSVIGNGSVAADIYSNDTKVGTLSLILVEKSGTDVWIGEIEVNENKYNAYLLEGKANFNKNEIKQRFQDICQNNETDCLKIAKGIWNRFCEKLDDISCREKIAEFCEENPTDQRCIAINKKFCQDNIDDARCRKLIGLGCLNNPNSEECLSFCQTYPEKCGLAQKNKEKIQERLKQIQENREKMREIVRQKVNR